LRHEYIPNIIVALEANKKSYSSIAEFGRTLVKLLLTIDELLEPPCQVAIK